MTNYSLQMLALAVEQSPIIVVITNVCGNIEYANPQFTKSTGYALEEAIGKNPRILKSGLMSDTVYQELWETILAGGVWKGELCNRRKNGELYWELASISPIRNANQEITHFLAVKEDITKRKQFEKELQKAKEEAEAANAAKSEFLANMSHEIRTPMNGIIGMTELALETELNTVQREYLELVHHSALALLEIINQILDISKIESGNLKVNNQVFDLQQVITLIVQEFTIRAKQRGLSFITSIDPQLPKAVCGDPGLIRQILFNLLGNAIKFTEQGRIELQIKILQMDAAKIHIGFTVSDTGIGIPDNKKDLLFQKFSQVDGSSTRKYGGTGLGLAIAKQLVELLGGTIRFDSQEGVGSTFEFDIWLQVSELPTETVTQNDTIAQEANRIAKRSQFKILLAEDNLINQKLIRALLEKQGYTVTIVNNGREALELLGREQFDLLLVDLQMPEVDGYEVTKSIRSGEQEVGRHLPIIALTAHAMEGVREQCLASGMDDYLSKPINSNELFGLLRRYLAVPSDDGQNCSYFNDLLGRFNGDQVVLKECINVFLKEAPPKLVSLRNCIISHDAPGMKAIAHKLKGSLVYFNAQSAIDLVRQFEEAAAVIEWETQLQLFDLLQREIDQLIADLTEIALTM
jgi:PAS domain S-box-containing protein